MLNRLESLNLDTNSNSAPFWGFSDRLIRYKFSTDLAFPDVSRLGKVLVKSNFSLLSSLAGVGGITGKELNLF